MKISSLVFFSIFFILLLFSITTYVNYRQSEKVRDNAEFLSASSDIVRQSNQFQRNMLYLERSLKGYIETKEDYVLQTYDSTIVENNAILSYLSSSLPANSARRKKLDTIKELYKTWFTQFAKPLAAAAVGKEVSSKNSLVFDFKTVWKGEENINKKLLQQFKELLNVEYENREKRKMILERSEHETKIISVLLTALSIVVGFAIAILLARYISNRILKMVKMCNSIARGNYKVQVEDGGNNELSELTRSLNNMAQMLELNISLLKRKNQELDQFAHIVSHDLKAPLRGIDNVLSWIEEDHLHEVPEKVNEYLQLIKGRIKRSEDLIQGILSYARIGKEAYIAEPVNVNSLITEILETLPIHSGLKVTVQTDMPDLYSEKVPLSQIFSNLISNAVKYHHRKNGEIKIYYKENRDSYTFFVEDDGPGIAKAYHRKIFAIFQTLVEKDSFESAGVGLAIVKKILDDRNEQIHLVSEPGKGSVFSFTWTKR